MTTVGPQNITLCIKHGPDHDGLYFVWAQTVRHIPANNLLYSCTFRAITVQ